MSARVFYLTFTSEHHYLAYTSGNGEFAVSVKKATNHMEELQYCIRFPKECKSENPHPAKLSILH